jgi:hypothetical protein
MTPRTKMLLIVGTALLAALFAFGVGGMLDRRDRQICAPLNPHCTRLPWGW